MIPPEAQVSVPDWATLEGQVRERLIRQTGFALATLNLDHLVKLRSDAAFRAAYAAQDLVTADGHPVVWAEALAGRRVALIPGSEAIVPLCRLAAEAGRPVAFVGSQLEVLEAARRHLEKAVAGLDVAIRIAPPMNFDPDGAAAEAIHAQLAAAGIGIAFVAMGAPRQECFAALGRRIAPGVGYASIGAGLDFFAGHQRRAPPWMRAIAMEWLWRMLSDPRRLAPRYAACAALMPRLFAGQLCRRFIG